MTNHLGSSVIREEFMEKPKATSAIVNPAQSRAIRSPEGKPQGTRGRFSLSPHPLQIATLTTIISHVIINNVLI